jgi:hypothetical protein
VRNPQHIHKVKERVLHVHGSRRARVAIRLARSHPRRDEGKVRAEYNFRSPNDLVFENLVGNPLDRHNLLHRHPKKAAEIPRK